MKWEKRLSGATCGRKTVGANMHREQGLVELYWFRTDHLRGSEHVRLCWAACLSKLEGDGGKVYNAEKG